MDEDEDKELMERCEERSAIMEVEGGLSKEEAEAKARESVFNKPDV